MLGMEGLPDAPLAARQLVPSGNDDSRTSRSRLCQSVSLPANGVLTLPGGEVITLSAPAAFKPACTTNTQPAIIAGTGSGTSVVDETAEISGPQFSDLSDPFYASTFPQCYALAATTVIAYTLVIMLVITPRSFLDGGVVVLGRRGFTSGGSGSGTIGGRPWLQKVAALTVAVSLTIATADTFRVAEEQYALGLQDARELQEKVLGGTELKIIRIISDTFLWLAQAQTLIRLFPRQREKVIIKWTAFALITLDLIFDSLNSFQYPGPGNTRPGSFTDAIPALSYLFQLALGVLYAAWVIYYSLMKKRYAYYHTKMKNISLVAMLSLFAILVPVVFFILDISKPEFTGWGDYVRWVGAAAASVIVWEWVERIEALEREEKRDGILGREVFDGDEMLETSSDSTWPRRSKSEKPLDRGDADDDGGEGGRRREGDAAAVSSRSHIWPTMSSIANRYRSRSRSRPPTGRGATAPEEAEPTRLEATNTRPSASFLQPPLWPSRPPPALTPISRTDTASADSTVYAIRYHPLTETTAMSATHPSTSPPPPLSHPQPLVAPQQQLLDPSSESHPSSHQAPNADSRPSSPQPLEARVPRSNSSATAEPAVHANAVSLEARDNTSAKRWRALALAIPFRRPPRVESAMPEDSASGRPHNVSQSPQNQQSRLQRGGRASLWDLRTRMEDFAATQAERIREKIRPTPDTDSLPVTVIPAPARRGAALTQLLEEEESRQDGYDAGQSSADAQGLHRNGSNAPPLSPRSPPPMPNTSRRRSSTGSVASSSSLNSGSNTGPSTAPVLAPLVVTAAPGEVSYRDSAGEGPRSP